MDRKVKISALKYLNADVLGVIIARDASLTSSLMMTCRVLLRYVKSHYNKKYCRLQGTTITLRFTQCMLRDTFKTMNSGTIFFKARKSFGKTITGYAAVGTCGLILTTPDVFKVWVLEAKNLGWYNSDPLKTKVLCYSGTQKHKQYIDSILASKRSIKPPRKVIVIVKDIHALIGTNFLDLVVTDEPKSLVVDEAHISRKAVIILQDMCKWNNPKGVFDKQLMLSADTMTPYTCGVNGPTYRMISVIDLDGVPIIQWHVLKSWLSEDSWIETLIDVLDKHERVVMVGTVEELDDILYYNIPILPPDADPKTRRAKNKQFYGAKIFYQKTGVDTTSNYNKYEGNCILLINTAQNKGVNVHADALFMEDAGTKNTTRITQTVGRIVRTTNDVDEVYIYLTARSELSFIRCHYARCFYTESWRFVFNSLPDIHNLRKCISILKLLGTSIVDINPVDGCIILCDTTLLENVFDVLEWWKINASYDTILTEDNVSDILCI